MRIIAGEYKGRQLVSPPFASGIRPLLARVRKSLFDILTPRLAGSKFLDLYAGSGLVGIEAISRGAKLAVFMDLDRKACDIIKRNLEKLGIGDKAAVHTGDATKNLAWLRLEDKECFDIIFIGAPYPKLHIPANLTSRTISNIIVSGILKRDAILVTQHHAKTEIELQATTCLYRQERYGDMRLSFIRATPNA